MSFKSPKDTTCAIEGVGCTKASLRWDKLLVLGFLAGAFIAFGGLLAIIVAGPGVNEGMGAGLRRFAFGGVFPVGLMLVVIAGAELFTGNTACTIPAVMSGKASWGGLARNWVLAYIGNFIGSLFVAFFLTTLSGLVTSEPYLSSVRSIAEGKVNIDWMVAFWRGVGCNWLVCLAVWLAVASEDVTGKIWGIWFPIMAFVALGFEHSIANMFFVPAGIFNGANATWGQFFLNNLIPVTLGNIIGGAFFVGFIYWWLYGNRLNASE
jgi:formate/nitrite transporter